MLSLSKRPAGWKLKSHLGIHNCRLPTLYNTIVHTAKNYVHLDWKSQKLRALYNKPTFNDAAHSYKMKNIVF